MKELFKNIALGANAVLLVVLFWLSVSVNVDLGSKDPLAPVSRWLRGEAAPTQTVETSVTPAAYPVRIVAVQQEGIAVAFQQEEVEPLFQELMPVFYEALGAAQPPEAMEEQAYWELSMAGPGFRLDFDGQMPLYALRIWAGAPESEGFDQSCSSVVLAAQGQEVVLAFQGADGAYYRCSTMAGADGLRKLLASAPPDGAFFAADGAVFVGEGGDPQPAYGGLAPDEVILPGSISLPSFEVTVPSLLTGQETPRGLLEAFSMNPYMENHYAESDGSMVYVQGNFVLRLGTDGRIQFSATGGEGLAADPGEGLRTQAVALIDLARNAAEDVLAQCDSSMTVSLRSITPLNEEGDYTIVFGCQVQGVPLSASGAGSIVAQAEDGVIVSLEMQVMNVSQGEEMELLPYEQAAAALMGRENARLLPRYRLQEGRLIPYMSYSTPEGAGADGLEKG